MREAESDIVIYTDGWVAARELRFPQSDAMNFGKQGSDSKDGLVLGELCSTKYCQFSSPMSLRPLT